MASELAKARDRVVILEGAVVRAEEKLELLLQMLKLE